MYSTLVLKEFSRLVTTDPEELRPKPYDFPWELVICVAIIGLFSVLLILWRSFQSVRSRLYARREKHLAVKLSGLIEEKCKLLDKLSLESSLKDARSVERHPFEAASTKGQLFGQPFPLYCHRRLQPMSLVVLSDCNDSSVFALHSFEESWSGMTLYLGFSDFL
jgi:hypothetical protein